MKLHLPSLVRGPGHSLTGMTAADAMPASDHGL